jgi:hypothetical protein
MVCVTMIPYLVVLLWLALAPLLALVLAGVCRSGTLEDVARGHVEEHRSLSRRR